jgi:RNA polymerase sigma factor (TIGR02999 family)
MAEHDDVTRLLAAVGGGDRDASERLLERVYEELRGLARVRLASERSRQAPQPTSLVHEAYLRLVGSGGEDWKNRAYFFAAAGEAMRRVLVDQARERAAAKRGGGMRRVPLQDDAAVSHPSADTVLAVDRSLERLQQRDPRMAQVAKLRWFAELSVRETAEAMDLPPRTVDRLWSAARAWLQRDMRG